MDALTPRGLQHARIVATVDSSQVTGGEQQRFNVAADAQEVHLTAIAAKIVAAGTMLADRACRGCCNPC